MITDRSLGEILRKLFHSDLDRSPIVRVNSVLCSVVSFSQGSFAVDMIAELANSGVVRGPVWPLPEILKDCNFEHAAKAQYVFSFRMDYDDRKEYDRNDISDVRDVYLHTDPKGKQSLVFADKWTTERNTYGSHSLDTVIYSVLPQRRTSNEITIIWAMLSLGKFSFSLN